ncbi:hypothetical protein Lal_00048318 [Lupinus albus]|uniref:Pectinesterase n=2 Tax=Lupinus albus TaxID=3870 RepID=A0A6A5M971_LUPAL|nr:putative pectinesterase [Lupinus albus]KAE9615436.1 putative pectinesterase [Lupinus albus]KAF1869038.1 hypothetical protein Lal_00048318 [Lupinus albus]
MASNSRSSIIHVSLMVAFLASNIALANDNVPIPAVKSQLNSWYHQNVKPLSQRKTTLDPALVAAESAATVIKVMQDGSGNFKTINEAIKSIPKGNTKRVMVYIGSGTYNEKIRIEREKPFITLYGAPGKMPNLTYGGTALEYGTLDSATLIVESDYFVASNIIISNSAPRPDGKRKGAQAVALRASGDKATFYKVTLLGFQDTLCDDAHWHIYKDCLIQGTVDFVFGNGKTLFLNTELRVLGDEGMSVITAHARDKKTDDTGYSFVHCDVTGTGNGTLLGRAWMSKSKVVFAYSNIGSVVNKAAWSNNLHPEYDGNLYFGEYKNKGPGADQEGRYKYTKQLSEVETRPFITLGYIQGSKWLLPPPNPEV